MVNLTLLTIDPGTRYSGLSVFHGRTFIVSFVKELSPKALPRNRLSKTRKTFLSLCRKFAPHILVIKRPLKSRESQSPYLPKIIEEIKHLAKKERIRIIEFSPKTIRKAVCQNEQATKSEMAGAIGSNYPELKEYLSHIQKCKHKYQWGRIVDSLALGICYLGGGNSSKSH